MNYFHDWIDSSHILELTTIKATEQHKYFACPVYQSDLKETILCREVEAENSSS